MGHVCGDDVGVRLGGPQGWVRLWNRTYPYGDDMVAFCIELGGDGMTAVAHGVVLAGGSPAAFVEGLAASFEGWSGVRAWQNPDRDVRIEAVFGSGGHVDLTWTVAPWREMFRWTASVTIKRVEAGEEMRRLAADLRELL
jgi:hypothetical protein